MAFSLPDFNDLVGLYVAPNTPGGGGPVAGTFKVQLYVVNKPYVYLSDTGAGVVIPQVIVRCPVDTYDVYGPLNKSVWETKDKYGHFWYYSTQWWDYIHRAFPNEYIECMCVQSDSFGLPPDGNR